MILVNLFSKKKTTIEKLLGWNKNKQIDVEKARTDYEKIKRQFGE